MNVVHISVAPPYTKTEHLQQVVLIAESALVPSVAQSEL